MTLNFAKLGTKLRNNTYQVYVRYQYKNFLTGKTTYEYFPTGAYLHENQIEDLIANRLPGKSNYELQAIKKRIEEVIMDYFNSTNNYPSKQYVEKKLAKETKTTPDYVMQYLNELKGTVKESSYTTNQTMTTKILHALGELSVQKKKNYVEDAKVFATESTTKELLQYFIDQGQKNGYTKPVMRLVVRIQNMIRKKYDLPTIEGNFGNLKSTYKQYMLNQDEISILINHKTKNQNYIDAQNLIKINQLIGLRIEELVNVHKTDVHFKKDHIIINLIESKKSKGREVVVADQEAIELIKQLIKSSTSNTLFNDLTRDDFNYRIKRLAKETGEFNEEKAVVRNVGKEIETERKPKWDLISTHSIRKFAVSSIAKKHGLQAAKYFSGHRSIKTIEDHYLDDLSNEDILSILKKG